MERVLILVVMLAGGIHALFPVLDTNCDATRGTTSCNATSGGSVYIQVMSNVSGHMVHCKMNMGSTKVFTMKKEAVKMHRDNAEFFISNGTLKLTNLTKNDTGQYRFDIYDHNGVLQRNTTVHLHVQDSQFMLILILVIACATFLLLVILLIICICCKMSAARKQKRTTVYSY